MKIFQILAISVLGIFGFSGCNDYMCDDKESALFAFQIGFEDFNDNYGIKELDGYKKLLSDILDSVEIKEIIVEQVDKKNKASYCTAKLVYKNDPENELKRFRYMEFITRFSWFKTFEKAQTEPTKAEDVISSFNELFNEKLPSMTLEDFRGKYSSKRVGTLRYKTYDNGNDEIWTEFINIK